MNRPFIPASTNLPEITPKALVLAFLLSAILAGANAYLGLKVGMTVSASIPAAVISMAVLRLFKRSNILENNIVQTSASAGESLAAGVIFTVPALILLQYWQGFSFWETLAISAFGGTLGVLFTIPLRRALITEGDLAFPEGVATGEVLKAGTTGGSGIRAIAIAGIAGAVIKLCQTGFKLFAGAAQSAFTVKRAVFGFGSDLSVALLAVGYIVGINIATVVLAGGLISWVVGIPLYSALMDPSLMPLDADGNFLTGFAAADALWDTQIRYLGVGAMAVGGLWALIELAVPLRDGIRSAINAVRGQRGDDLSSIPRTERDTPITYVAFGTIGLAIPLFFVFLGLLDQEALGVSADLYWSTVVFAVVFSLFAGFVFSAVSGYMAGLIGSSNNPISGVTIATILSVSLLLLLILGLQVDFELVDSDQATSAAAAAIMVGAVVCCAASIAGDNMQDLKAGQIVGATPYKQQIMQIVGVVAAALVIAPILELLFQAYGLGGVFPRPGMDPAEMLEAPQATLMSSVAQGVFARDLPWTMIAIGGGIAVLIIAFDEWLKRRGSTFRWPVLAVAVGIYLPLDLDIPIFLGGLVAYLASRVARRRAQGSSTETSERQGLLFASGLITGEALVGIILAIPFAAAQSTDVLRIPGVEPFATGLGLLAFALMILWLYRVATSRSADNGSSV